MNDMRALESSLGRLLGYLRSWQCQDGQLGGIIGTWWSSTLMTAVPHPMNQFPTILAFLELHRGNLGGGDWLAEACRIGDGLVGIIQPDGLMKDSWGDIPGKGTGTVIYAGPSLALSELHMQSGKPHHLLGAKRLLDTIDQRWTARGINSDGVTNQGLKWAEAMLAYGKASGDDKYISRAVKVGKKYLEQQITNGSLKGAFYQSRTDDRLISVYQGKCLVPLLRLYQATSDEVFLESARMLGKYLIGQKVEGGVFLNYREPSSGLRSALASIPRRLDWRIFRRRLPMYKCWRWVPGNWKQISFPSFIARSGDTLRGLWMLGQHDSDFCNEVQDLTRLLLSYQLPHGGFPNTVGYMGKVDCLDWQDVCCPTRWNAYVFLFLASLASEEGKGLALKEYPFDVEFRRQVGNDDVCTYVETSDSVRFFSEGKLVAELVKPTGESAFLADGWEGDLTGERSRQNMQLS